MKKRRQSENNIHKCLVWLALACLVAKLDNTEIFYKIIQRKLLQFICFYFPSKGYKVSQERRSGKQHKSARDIVSRPTLNAPSTFMLLSTPSFLGLIFSLSKVQNGKNGPRLAFGTTCINIAYSTMKDETGDVGVWNA